MSIRQLSTSPSYADIEAAQQIVANILGTREQQPNPVIAARALQILEQAGLIDQVSISKNSIKNRLAILEFPEAMLNLLEEGIISAAQADRKSVV